MMWQHSDSTSLGYGLSAGLEPYRPLSLKLRGYLIVPLCGPPLKEGAALLGGFAESCQQQRNGETQESWFHSRLWGGLCSSGHKLFF